MNEEEVGLGVGSEIKRTCLLGRIGIWSGRQSHLGLGGIRHVDERYSSPKCVDKKVLILRGVQKSPGYVVEEIENQAAIRLFKYVFFYIHFVDRPSLGGKRAATSRCFMQGVPRLQRMRGNDARHRGAPETRSQLRGRRIYARYEGYMHA